jgi:hypothetical protein
MVERRDGLIPTAEQDAVLKVVAKAFHCEGIRTNRKCTTSRVVVQIPERLLPSSQGVYAGRVKSDGDKGVQTVQQRKRLAAQR